MPDIDRIITCDDDNIGELRAKYPNGLHFVVGDTHGACETLKALMNKICFDPLKDHVYFVGDYNGGGNIYSLMNYISKYYSSDYNVPGFHLIRGNHERWCGPAYYLQNLPDIIVLRCTALDYYIVHAGMIKSAYDVIREDINSQPDKRVFSYRLDDGKLEYDEPLRMITWSRGGQYSQKDRYRHHSQRSKFPVWPPEDVLKADHSCIIHGHAPYSYFKKDYGYSYGENNLFWQNQHIIFSESLQSFNMDSDIKGKNKNGETYRGLACVCLEVLEEIASQGQNGLTVEGIRRSQNGVFGAEHIYNYGSSEQGDISRILNAHIEMKTLSADDSDQPYLY